MPDLEMLLRDIRPVPEPAFAAALDARVAHGFPAPPPRWQRPFRALREHFLALGTVTAIAGVIAFLVVAGVSSDGGDEPASSAGGSMSSKAAATPQMAGGEDSAGSAGEKRLGS